MKSKKNIELIDCLEKNINDMCGVGTRNVKLFLNRKAKDGDKIAWIYRELLEIETLNINAKRYNNTYSFSYRESYYGKKHECLNNLLEQLIKENTEGVVFGKERSDVDDTSWIVYFEAPGISQVSFHSDIRSNIVNDVPEYEKEWDGKINSTLKKLDTAITHRYGEELHNKYKEQYNKFLKKKEINRIREEKKKEKKLFENKAKTEIINALKGDIESIINLPQEYKDSINIIVNGDNKGLLITFCKKVIAFAGLDYNKDGINALYETNLMLENDKEMSFLLGITQDRKTIKFFKKYCNKINQNK